MKTRRGSARLVLGGALALLTAASASGQASQPTDGELLASGLEGSIGSAIGPDGALYVPEATLGRITRLDPETGEATTLAEGLPPGPFPGAGAIDVAFIGETAYALVTLVFPDHVAGIYRIDDPGTSTVIANLGAFSVANPPPYPVDAPAGLQFALQPVTDGFMVTDGHHNRVLHATLAGEVTEVIAFENVVPTGIAVSGDIVYVAEAGPVPHDPATGKIVRFAIDAPVVTDVASGYSLLVDVEFGPGGRLYALSQGDSPGDVFPGDPAKPTSGKLLRVNDDGTLSVLVDALNLPTSLEFVDDTAFVVTLNGEVQKIEGI
jgi:hypothetical protein